MPHPISRRSLLLGLPALATGALLTGPARAVGGYPVAADSLHSGIPRVEPTVVQSFVGLAHRDPVEVRRMVERQPALARASWDWGFGDWETALGAAAHTGGREIAELVLSHGAHPTLFSAAMLGQLDVVRAIVTESPGIQRTPGPHGLTLLHHARVGGKGSESVVAYLESVGGADTRAATTPLETPARDLLVGGYVFGPGANDWLDVDVKNDRLGLQRRGGNRIMLWHTGSLVFFPSGVPSVRIAFTDAGDASWQLAISDPDVYLTARRQK